MLQYTNSPMITKYSVYMFKIVDNLLKTYYFVCWVVQKIVCLLRGMVINTFRNAAGVNSSFVCIYKYISTFY